ncbi:hypothetical protein CAP31_07755 [Sulfuriferula sp. AH1]|uniref:DUF2185 domain-containing protein n=1 Tax=Sulfuriferula sp. AH1 TaxID=1985873 RepID=UPI000B563A66|nr:DUF2185 domain-containing protein [Sulfuriferula sp. AH1]ARU31589.1 hypothetical protein CAP31_07755 [Sulfuriferula sp. AH1]
MNRGLFLYVLIFSAAPLISLAEQPKNMTMPVKTFAIPKQNIRELISLPFAGFATDRIMVEGKKIGYMYREATTRTEDSGWRFFSGDENQDYINDLSHTGVYALNTVANYDPDIIPYLNTPAPCAFEKIPGSNKYRPVAP